MDLNLNIVILARDARSYYDAYEVLRGKNKKLFNIQSNELQKHQEKYNGFSVPIPITEHDMDLSTPALVCLAFSTELHIKLLLRTYDVITKGHDVEKLIGKLPKDEIKRISTHPDFHPTQQGQKFFENIATASDLFIRTRYYFEDMGTLHFNTGFCITLAQVIRKRIIQRVPYLSYDLGFCQK